MKIRKLTKKEVSTLVTATGTLVVAAGTGILIGMVLRVSRDNPTRFLTDNLKYDILHDLFRYNKVGIQLSDAVSEDDYNTVMNLFDTNNVRFLFQQKSGTYVI